MVVPESILESMRDVESWCQRRGEEARERGEKGPEVLWLALVVSALSRFKEGNW